MFGSRVTVPPKLPLRLTDCASRGRRVRDVPLRYNLTLWRGGLTDHVWIDTKRGEPGWIEDYAGVERVLVAPPSD